MSLTAYVDADHAGCQDTRRSTSGSAQFIDPPFEEEILAFIRKLGDSRNIKSLFDAKVEILPQPWRTFGTIINKCLSGKVTGNDLLLLSRAQILWGMYYQKNVDYVNLLWEDLVYQIENKVSKKNKDMYYLRYTKVIINHFMLKDQSIPRRNKEGTSVIPWVPDVPLYGSKDEQISWKSSDDENDNENESDNNGDDFVHFNSSTFDEEKRRKEKLDEKEEGSDQGFHTPSHFESTDDEAYDEVTQGDNVEKEKLDEEKTNKDKEVNELYKDVNINLEGRDIEMIDALLANVQATQVIEDTHVIMTAVTSEVQQ
uniref:Monodehydroascorbate reductase n=1 Tax=Tanacetum cinerariifolium TaxID=118510 RepID=A0A6L2KUD0_TANCI|nr:monodehydroascorbate reductase [Tanacetum cinerariifolium]